MELRAGENCATSMHICHHSVCALAVRAAVTALFLRWTYFLMVRYRAIKKCPFVLTGCHMNFMNIIYWTAASYQAPLCVAPPSTIVVEY
jgi:hypothetical protein